MATRKKPETSAKVYSDKVLHHEASKKIAVNRRTVVDLVLYGRSAEMDAIFTETYRTLSRLGLAETKAKPFASAPRGAGGPPNIFDIIRWLDAIDTSDAYAADRLWLMRLHATADLRVDPAVRDEVTKR